MAAIKLVVDGARMAELLRSPSGPVYRMLFARGEVVRQAAKAKAPVKSGCLRDSIVKRMEERAEGLACRVVADTTPCSPKRTSYALFVEEGTRPHTIQGNPTLSFFWPTGPDGPGLYHFASVNHPGTKGIHFMRDALPLAAV